METPFFSTLGAAIAHMHHSYGIGDLLGYGYFADGRLQVTEKGYGMKPRIRRGRIQFKTPYEPFGKVTVKMYGRQFTFSIIGGAI